MVSINFNYLLIGPVSKYYHTEGWRARESPDEFRGHNSVHNKWWLFSDRDPMSTVNL